MIDNDKIPTHSRHPSLPASKWRPATILNWDADGQLSVSGSFIEVVQYFQSNLNFSCKWARSKDETWGVRRPDGSWNGMVGDLVEGRADVAVGVALSPDRDSSVDFTLQINEGGYYLIIRRPGLNTGLTWSSYTQEFSTWSWVSAGVTLLLLACAFSVVTVHQPRSPSAVPFPDALLTVFGAMCQQGSTFQARGTPTRIAFLTIFLFGTVLYIFYCTFLISALSVVKSNLPFTNLAGLLRVGTHQLVVASGTIVEATIKTSTSPLYKRAWQNILDGDPDSFASHYTDCALRALKKRHACLLEISEYMYEHSKNLQLVALTEEKYGRFSVGIAVADKSPLKDLFNVQLVRMKMTGILDKIMTKWRIEPPGLRLHLRPRHEHGVHGVSLRHHDHRRPPGSRVLAARSPSGGGRARRRGSLRSLALIPNLNPRFPSNRRNMRHMSVVLGLLSSSLTLTSDA
nr:glutamate receptor ionotropic, delta-1-like [Penaeus vannamei]